MPAGYDAEVAELFRDLRAASGLSEAELAARLGTNAEVVQALEQGAIYALPAWPETCRIVTSYGSLLNLDVRPLLRRIYAQLEAGIVGLAPKPVPDVPFMVPPEEAGGGFPQQNSVAAPPAAEPFPAQPEKAAPQGPRPPGTRPQEQFGPGGGGDNQGPSWLSAALRTWPQQQSEPPERPAAPSPEQPRAAPQQQQPRAAPPPQQPRAAPPPPQQPRAAPPPPPQQPRAAPPPQPPRAAPPQQPGPRNHSPAWPQGHPQQPMQQPHPGPPPHSGPHGYPQPPQAHGQQEPPYHAQPRQRPQPQPQAHPQQARSQQPQAHPQQARSQQPQAQRAAQRAAPQAVEAEPRRRGWLKWVITAAMLLVMAGGLWWWISDLGVVQPSNEARDAPPAASAPDPNDPRSRKSDRLPGP